MRTVLDILKKAGGWRPGLYLKIDNQPYLPLVIEAVDESGPMGLPALSVAHYSEQNGDLMRDPEMCFELGFNDGPELNPYFYRNDYVGVEQWSRNIVRDHYVQLVSVAQAAPSASPGRGTTTCVCRASPKPSTSTSMYADSPIPTERTRAVRSTPSAPNPSSRRAQMQNSSEFQYLAIDTIHESATNPRRTFDTSRLEELAESIRSNGLIQPITVRPNSAGFEIVAGARRFRAAQLAELFSLPARIVEIDDAQTLEWQLVEN